MIRVDKLSYGFPQKDLYKDVSFTIEEGRHCVLIGSNGCGKTTLVDILLNDEKYLYDGKITRSIDGRVGYTSQFDRAEKEEKRTVFEYLAQDFVRIQDEMDAVCKQMETAEELDELLLRYQEILDESLAMDADHYETNIYLELKVAGLSGRESLYLEQISGGEFKLLQVIRQMLRKPTLLVMDEPDVFLDFENLNGLRELINSYKGTILAVTHNRYLLHHCFDKILHLEDCDIQEFDGSFTEYNFYLLAKKVELQEQVAKEQEEIERNEKLVEKLRANATRVTSASRGKALHARVSYLERLEARRIKAPFVNLRIPQIALPQVGAKEANVSLEDAPLEDAPSENMPLEKAAEEEAILTVENYRIAYEDPLLEEVSFALHRGEKVAVVGANGTGKTTLLRDIFRNQDPAIRRKPGVEVGFLSQIHGEMLDETKTVYEEMESLQKDGAPVFEKHGEIAEYLADYCFEPDVLKSKIEVLSGGEKNLLQLAKISVGEAELLLLDEPTSHLDTYAQVALEKAIAGYSGAVLMVSHDFYTIANCVDYVLFVENKTVRKMRIRSFRKMIYENHFRKDYLELEQKKKELEARIERCLKDNDYLTAKTICESLEEVVGKMSQK